MGKYLTTSQIQTISDSPRVFEVTAWNTVLSNEELAGATGGKNSLAVKPEHIYYHYKQNPKTDE